MRDLWKTAEFVPHWFVMLIFLAASSLGAWAMYAGSVSFTLKTPNTACYIVKTDIHKESIGLILRCGDASNTSIMNTKVVVDAIAGHAKSLICDVYENGSADNCKIPE